LPQEAASKVGVAIGKVVGDGGDKSSVRPRVCAMSPDPLHAAFTAFTAFTRRLHTPPSHAAFTRHLHTPPSHAALPWELPRIQLHPGAPKSAAASPFVGWGLCRLVFWEECDRNGRVVAAFQVLDASDVADVVVYAATATRHVGMHEVPLKFWRPLHT